jgi:hypothetical protein
LPSDKKVMRIDDYSCMDYLWSLDAKDKVYKDILELLGDQKSKDDILVEKQKESLMD